MTRAALAASIVLLLAADVSGCAREPAAFAVKEVIPRPEQGALRLNDELTIVFTAPVDPSSVGPQSLRVWSADGAPIEGSFEVGDDRVTFVPRPVSAPDWSDGGWRPGQRVDVSLSAYPDRTGVMSTDGMPLDRPLRLRFSVLDPRGAPAASPPPFRDVAIGAGPALVNRALLVADGGDRVRVRPDGRIRLAFSEPLDPRTVTSDTIRVRFDNPQHANVPCELTLVQSRRSAEVFVRPRDGFPTDSPLILDLGAPGPTDLVGTPFEGTVLLRVDGDPAAAECAGGAP